MKKEIGDALRAIDYKGPVVMEPFVRPGGTVSTDVALWRDLSDDGSLDSRAAESLSFVMETFAD